MHYSLLAFRLLRHHSPHCLEPSYKDLGDDIKVFLIGTVSGKYDIHVAGLSLTGHAIQNCRGKFDNMLLRDVYAMSKVYVFDGDI